MISGTGDEFVIFIAGVRDGVWTVSDDSEDSFDSNMCTSMWNLACFYAVEGCWFYKVRN